jgi:hypothetical protein
MTGNCKAAVLVLRQNRPGSARFGLTCEGRAVVCNAYRDATDTEILILADDVAPISGTAWADPEKARPIRSQPGDLKAGAGAVSVQPDRAIPGLPQPCVQHLRSQLIFAGLYDQCEWMVATLSAMDGSK